MHWFTLFQSTCLSKTTKTNRFSILIGTNNYWIIFKYQFALFYVSWCFHISENDMLLLFIIGCTEDDHKRTLAKICRLYWYFNTFQLHKLLLFQMGNNLQSNHWCEGSNVLGNNISCCIAHKLSLHYCYTKCKLSSCNLSNVDYDVLNKIWKLW